MKNLALIGQQDKRKTHSNEYFTRIIKHEDCVRSHSIDFVIWLRKPTSLQQEVILEGLKKDGWQGVAIDECFGWIIKISK